MKQFLPIFFSFLFFKQFVNAQTQTVSIAPGWSYSVLFGGDGDYKNASNTLINGGSYFNGSYTSTINEQNRLRHPYDIKFSPDGTQLWVTEKKGGLNVFNPNTGARTKLSFSDGLTAANAPYTFAQGDLNTYFGGTAGNTVANIRSRWATNPDQGGLLGFDFDPNFATNNYVYVAYCYLDGSNNRKTRIARYTYTAALSTLSNPVTLIENLPNSYDHNSGRILIGPLSDLPANRKLFYSLGDQGNNQFANVCKRIRALDLPTAAEIASQDYTKYQGKILRINLDGSIPTDNPTFRAEDNFVQSGLPADMAVQSHIYSYGHRNPQGLTFSPYNATLYSSEQGPRSDDEINIISSGNNYGWPRISGDKDNSLSNTSYQYIDWSASTTNLPVGWCLPNFYQAEDAVPGGSFPSGASIVQESSYTPTVKFPIYRTTTTVTTWNGYSTAGFLSWPTWAMSSVKYYKSLPSGKIPTYDSSLMVSTLKKGALYRLKLDASGNGVVGDSTRIIIMENRIRDFAISPNGLNIYLITDSTGNTSGPTNNFATDANKTILFNKGAIIKLTYSGTILNQRNEPVNYNNNNVADLIAIYPNPAQNEVNINYPPNIGTKFRVNIIASNGGIVQQMIINNNQKISLGHLAMGVYQMQFFDDYGVLRANKKLIKVK